MEKLPKEESPKEKLKHIPTDYNYADWLLHRLEKAYYKAKKGKSRTLDCYKYRAFWLKNTIQLRDDIMNRRYKPSRGIAFVTLKPVIREIFAAPFRDRIVHHFIFDMTYDWWDRRFIYDSYSCREGKGTLFGIRRLEHHIRSVSHNYTRPAYVLKFDIQGFFMGLPRAGLYEQVEKGLSLQFADNKPMYDLLCYLWKEIIFDDPVKGVKKRGPLSRWKLLPKSKTLFGQPSRFGIVIGNLTSQLLSNIYLNLLDRFVMFDLGYKHYGRYVDDFYIVVTEDEFEQAKKDIEKIRAFLKDIGLTLHPKKCYIQEVQKGIEFLGVVIYPGRTVMGRRFKRNVFRAAIEVGMGVRDADSIVSYLGHGKHFSSKMMFSRLFARMGWRYYF